MNDVPVLRIARPTDHLAAIAQMYSRGLGLQILGSFIDHDGFDGVILGHPHCPYHLEFTSKAGLTVGCAPNPDHLLVFYLPDIADWECRSTQMLAAGFIEVQSCNPYWDVHGRTFQDVDEYRVVLQNAASPA